MKILTCIASLVLLPTCISQHSSISSFPQREEDSIVHQNLELALQGGHVYDVGNLAINNPSKGLDTSGKRGYRLFGYLAFPASTNHYPPSNDDILSKRDLLATFTSLERRDAWKGALASLTRSKTPNSSKGKEPSQDTSGSIRGSPDPPFPPGADKSKTHIWIRTNTEQMFFRPQGLVSHNNLNRLMQSICGKHVDVVYSEKNKFKQVGLFLAEQGWTRKNPNADGSKVVAITASLEKGAKDHYVYMGHIEKANEVKKQGKV